MPGSFILLPFKGSQFAICILRVIDQVHSSIQSFHPPCLGDFACPQLFCKVQGKCFALLSKAFQLKAALGSLWHDQTSLLT